MENALRPHDFPDVIDRYLKHAFLIAEVDSERFARYRERMDRAVVSIFPKHADPRNHREEIYVHV